MKTNIQTKFELTLQVVYPVGMAEAQFCFKSKLPTTLWMNIRFFPNLPFNLIKCSIFSQLVEHNFEFEQFLHSVKNDKDIFVHFVRIRNLVCTLPSMENTFTANFCHKDKISQELSKREYCNFVSVFSSNQYVYWATIVTIGLPTKATDCVLEVFLVLVY